MSLQSDDESAETRFRDAFERLKANKPHVVPRGSEVSQANVAREAGTDPSALRKSRYPGLIREIQAWTAPALGKREEPVQAALEASRRRNVDMAARLEQAVADRDAARSLLMQANLRIVELTQQVHSLREERDRNVVPLNRRARTQN